jgi:hypothetical protein
MNFVKELEFIDKIDCNFPYHDHQTCLNLIDEALGISPNSVFAVVEEICRIPDEERENTPFLFLMDLLKTIDRKFEHPLKELVFKVAKRMIKQEETSVEETALNIEQVRPHVRQYAALNIIYYSCFDDEGKLNKAWDSIIREWDNE